MLWLFTGPLRCTCWISFAPVFSFIMPPTLEKVKGHIALARPSFCMSIQNLLRCSFKISYIVFLIKKLLTRIFFKSGVARNVELCPF